MASNEATENYSSDGFYDRVKTLVKQNSNMTLREFIVSTGMKPESYYSLKKLNNFPRCNDALKIANALGVSLDFLITGKSPKQEISTEEIDEELFSYSDEIKNVCDTLSGLTICQRGFVLNTLMAQVKYFKERKR